MEKSHHPTQKDLDVLISKLNALEVSATDNFQKSLVGVLKVLAENQLHSINEFEHLKKAIDLLTLQIFKVERKVDSWSKSSNRFCNLFKNDVKLLAGGHLIKD